MLRETPAMRAVARRLLPSARHLRMRIFWCRANQHRFRSGAHSAASLLPFCKRFTAGLANVRVSRSEENRRFVAASAAERPLSWASDRASICRRRCPTCWRTPRAGVRALDDAVHASGDARLDGPGGSGSRPGRMRSSGAPARPRVPAGSRAGLRRERALPGPDG